MSNHHFKLASLSEVRSVAARTNSLQGAFKASKRVAALRTAWLKHTVQRAITAVRSASDEDYGAFGWDRSDLLTKLQFLSQQIEHPHGGGTVASTITLGPAGLSRHAV